VPIDHFNLIAGFYDRSAGFVVTEQLLRLLDLSPRSILLDAGGGTGRVSVALRSKVDQVVVADLSLGMLRHARNKGLPTVYSPVEFLPFPPAVFDRVIMVDAFHHVLDQRRTADELWRVLAPKGRILIVEPDIHQIAIKFLALGEKAALMRSHFLSH
jgi:ubiquinone/menaquinone biosynthesis C-methylase UbiE